MTTTVKSGGKSEVVDHPIEGKMLFEDYKEDGKTERQIYQPTTSVSLANYKAGGSIQIGENSQYQASYIFTHMKQTKEQ